MPPDNRAPAPLTAEEELRSERFQFALAERAARFGYWRSWLTDGRLTWSPGMYEILGVDPKEKPDNKWLLSQIVEEDVQFLLDRINTAIKTRSGFYYRSRARFADAKAQIVDTHGEVEVGPDGRVVSVIGVCHDVTQQVRAEEEREKAERIYRLMTEEASDIIALYGTSGRITFVSNALQRTLGLTIEDVEDGKFLNHVHPADIEEAHKISRNQQDGSSNTACFRMRHRDGHHVWIECTVRPVHGEDGMTRHVISVARDVSERKAQELFLREERERAEAANRAKSTFLANMSHELRTPLNAIIGFSDIMHEEVLGPIGNPRYHEYASLIRQSGQLLLDLISDILDMAKIEAGKMDMFFENVNLCMVAAECTKLLGERAQQKGVNLTASALKHPITIEADRRAMVQMVLNLVSNAIKFTPPGGDIVLSAEHTGDHILLRVRDTGIGIAEEDLPRLGKAFEQVSADPALAKGGTGLGLALVNALAAKHGGTMQIESELGTGTTVTLGLPVRQAAKAAA